MTAQIQKINKQFQIHKYNVSKQIEYQMTTPPENQIIYDAEQTNVNICESQQLLQTTNAVETFRLQI